MKNKFFCLLLVFLPLALMAQQADSTDTVLKEATVKATRLIFVMKKDTVVYDMDALQASAGDMLGDVIHKMPGLELRDGVLYFKGRQVNRLLVNGTDFVRGDTKKGLDNLPAYIIKNVKAYEGKTDQAKVTGIDDGVKEQVVDIILKKEYMGTWTGNADLGCGTDDYWRIRAFANTFTDRFRASLYAGMTNTGQFQSAGQNGDWSDNNGAGGSSGETTYKKPGFSLMWHNGKNDQAGFFKVEASGAWDYRGHNDYYRNNVENYLDDGTSTYSSFDTRQVDDEHIWGGRIYLTWKPTKKTHVEYGPNFSYTRQTNRSSSRTGVWSEPVTERYAAALDSLVAHRKEGWPGDAATNLQMKEHSRESDHYTYGQWLWATHQFTENNWRLSMRHQLSYTTSRSHQHTITQYHYFRDEENELPKLINRYTDSRTPMFTQQTFLDLNIPLKLFETLRLTYGNTSSRNHSDNRGYRLDELGGIFADYEDYLANFGRLPDDADWQALSRDLDVTLNSITTEKKNWAEAYLQFRRKHFFASVQSCWRFAHDEIDYRKAGTDPVLLDRNATEYVFNSLLRYETDSLGKFDLTYYYDISPTSISNLITVPNTADPLSLSTGNPFLRHRRQHKTSFKYDRNFRQSRQLSINASWSVTKNSTAWRSTYDKTTGVSTSRPENISGLWNTNVGVYFSTPLDSKQRFQFTTSLNYQLSHQPTYSAGTSGLPRRRSDDNHATGLRASFNFRANKFFATLAGQAIYTFQRSTEALTNGISTWSNAYSASVQYVFPWDIELKTTARIRHNIGWDVESFNPVRTIWNANISKSLLRDKSLSIQLELSDILNQRDQSGAWNSVSGKGTYYSLTVGRFAMLHVIYRFSTKKQ